MKNILKFLICTMSLSLAAEIQNIQVAQRIDGSGTIDLNYDLIDSEGTFPSFTISIEMSMDGGEYQSYSLLQMSGDVGENVIPGVGKNIEIQAPQDTYSNNVMFKIIASAQVVSGDLPFTMIAISSVEGVSSYQNELISYSFEIMQNELTNTNLVEFLETYEFPEVVDTNYNYSIGLSGDEIYTTLSPIFDCSNYYDLHNSVFDNNMDDNGTVWGCVDNWALNYNYETNTDNDSCIYQTDIGCQNGDYIESGETEYSDCSCNVLEEIEITIHSPQYNGGGCTPYDWNNNIAEHIDLNALIEEQLDDELSNANLELTISYCSDPLAINYNEAIASECTNMTYNNGESCCFQDQNTCVYECDTSYLAFNTDPPEDYSDGGMGSEVVNIEDFSTRDISFAGSSFVIESGQGNRPVQFNFDNCVDAVIVSSMLDYYGLRIPTGGEWMKAARGNNERCWPWLSGDCADEATTWCSSNPPSCNDFNYNDCVSSIEPVELCTLDCQNISGSPELGTGCYGNLVNSEEECDAQLADCISSCQYYYDVDTQNCTMQQNNCVNELNDCINDKTSLCLQIEEDPLLDVLTTLPYPADEDILFQYSIFNNRFYYEKLPEMFDFSTGSLPDTSIQSFPSGISPFGLYDVIGNLPELVKYDNKYWAIGSMVAQDRLASFCYQNETVFQNNSSSLATQVTASDTDFSATSPIYGIRLIRTTQ